MTATLSPEYVKGRVNDWKGRLEILFNQVESVAVRLGSLFVSRSNIPRRDEEIMKRYDVSAPQLTKLTIKGSKGSVELVPVGLWVIGANGRLDVFVNGEPKILVDISERGNTSQWMLFDSQNRQSGVPFDEQIVEELLRAII